MPVDSEQTSSELALPSPPSADIEQRKIYLEERKHEAEVRDRDRTFELQKKELDAKLADLKRSRLINPLSLAVLAAFIAGITSIAAQYVTGRNQIRADKEKHTQEMETEAFKAESARILEAIRSGDPDKAACNLRFFLDASLISTPKMREFIEGYIASRNGGSGVSIGSIAQQGSQTETGTQPSATGANKLAEREICSPTTGSTATQTPPKQPSPPKADNGSVEIFITEWMPGGHNQNEACARGIQEFQKKFPNKTLTRVGSNEESRKDWMGHVEYKYYCTIRVGG